MNWLKLSFKWYHCSILHILRFQLIVSIYIVFLGQSLDIFEVLNIGILEEYWDQWEILPLDLFIVGSESTVATGLSMMYCNFPPLPPAFVCARH